MGIDFMNFSNYQKKISLKYLVSLSVVILFGVLFFGLMPKDFYFSNDVTWITEQPGIRFGRYGIAYTDPIKELMKNDDSKTNGFSIEIVLKPASYHKHGANFILGLHNEKDSDQLLMWQWLSSIIVMNGDDYDHKRKTKRIAVKLASVHPNKRFITITTGTDGTDIYLDGIVIHKKKDMILKIPEGEKTRLILGNSVYGSHGWKGDIYGLAFYRKILSDHDVEIHFDQWFKNQKFMFLQKYKPAVLYSFDEKGGRSVFDHAGGNLDLKIPSMMQILEKRILPLKRGRFNFDSGFIKDTIINFAGFMPLGFVFIATFVKAGGFFERHGTLITVILCLTASLTIEVFQAWIPSRSSDCLDLILNTLGALLGLMTYRFLMMGRASFSFFHR